MTRRMIGMCLSFGLAAIAARPARSEAEAGRVLSVRREAFRIREEQSEQATPQMPLLVRDAVRTGERSRAKLFFTDDSVFNLGEQSCLSVEQYLYSPEKERSTSVLKLVDGSLKAVVGRSDLEIHTPTAVAAARGTKFIVCQDESEGAPRSRIMVLSGEVAVWSTDKKNAEKGLLGAGWMSSVRAGEPPLPAVRIPPDVLIQHTQATRVFGRTAAAHTPRERATAQHEVLRPHLTQEPVDALSARSTLAAAVSQFRRSSSTPSPLVVFEPPKTEPPQTEIPKTEPPEIKPPETEPPETEPPETEPEESFPPGPPHNPPGPPHDPPGPPSHRPPPFSGNPPGNSGKNH